MRRTNQFERTDRDIVNALFAVMETTPFEKITVQMILDEARINRSTFYQHFPDKYAILERIQENFVAGITARVQETVRTNEMDLERINAVLCGYLSENRKKLSRMLSVRTEQFDLKQRFRELFISYFKEDAVSLSDFELSMTAGLMVEYFEYFLQNKIGENEFAEFILSSFLHMAAYFFRIDHVPAADEALLSVVKKLRNEKTTV